MKIKFEKSQKICTLSLLLCLGAIMLSVVYFTTKIIFFLGGQVDIYLISVYTLIPPNYVQNPLPVTSIISHTQPLTPIKDILYGFIMGTLFLFFGYVKFRLRWLFHFIVAALGLTMLALFFTGRNSELNFIGSQLIIASFCILVVITGLEIYHSKQDNVNIVKYKDMKIK